MDRAISTTLGYVITLGVTSLLITGLLIAGGGFVQDTREGTVRGELEVIGQQLVADIASADRLVEAGGSTVRITREIPDKISGRPYTISITDNGAGPSTVTLTLNTEDPDVSVDVTVWSRTDVQNGGVDSGELVIRYTGSDIEVSGA